MNMEMIKIISNIVSGLGPVASQLGKKIMGIQEQPQPDYQESFKEALMLQDKFNREVKQTMEEQQSLNEQLLQSITKLQTKVDSQLTWLWILSLVGCVLGGVSFFLLLINLMMRH